MFSYFRALGSVDVLSKVLPAYLKSIILYIITLRIEKYLNGSSTRHPTIMIYLYYFGC